MFVYHPGFLFGSRFLNALHPFEFDRARQAAELLETALGPGWRSRLRTPRETLTLEGFREVHEPAYLASLGRGRAITSVVEVPLLSWLPYRWLYGWFLAPTLCCAAGTLTAGRAALQEGWAMNLGGGFHHAKRAGGEGFCLLSDISLTLHCLRSEGLLTGTDRVVYIDLDVHQGNGVSTDFGEDPLVTILDLYNEEIYPVNSDPQALEGVDIQRPLPPGTEDTPYLEALESGLSELTALCPNPRLVIYNAGSDVFTEDRLGGLSLTRDGVAERDRAVCRWAQRAGAAVLVLPSGGYSLASAQLVADLGETLCRELER